jgi:hypothetical protein
MSAIELKSGIKVTNQYGEKLTVLEVNLPMVKTYEDSLNLYHVANLFFEGKKIKL